MRQEDRQQYLDMIPRVFVRALRDPNGNEEYELSEGEATSLLIEREAIAPGLVAALTAAVEIIDKWIEPETMGVVCSGDGVLGHYLRDEYLMNFRAALAKVSPQAVSEEDGARK